MSPLYRTYQLSDENALLRSQLQDAQEQAKRDSETIARLARDKSQLWDSLEKIADLSGRHHHVTIADLGSIAIQALSRHA